MAGVRTEKAKTRLYVSVSSSSPSTMLLGAVLSLLYLLLYMYFYLQILSGNNSESSRSLHDIHEDMNISIENSPRITAPSTQRVKFSEESSFEILLNSSDNNWILK